MIWRDYNVQTMSDYLPTDYWDFQLLVSPIISGYFQTLLIIGQFLYYITLCISQCPQAVPSAEVEGPPSPKARLAKPDTKLDFFKALRKEEGYEEEEEEQIEHGT